MTPFRAIAAAALATVALSLGLPAASATAATAPPTAAPATTAPATPSPAASPSATPTSSAGDVTVTVSPENNGVVTAGGDLTATVTVHNGSDADLGVGIVRLYLDRASFTTRTALESWFDRPAATLDDALGSFMASADVAGLKAGFTSGPVTVTIPAAQLDLGGSAWGAKAFGVRYSADGGPVAEQHSSVVYSPSADYQPTGISMAAPITVPSSTSGLISSDALAAYTSRFGILTQELQAVRGKPVALGIDPMILASIRILGNAAPPSAIVWLKQLETAPNETFALSYGDVDISALRQAGSTRLPAPIDFAAAIRAQQKAAPSSYAAVTATGEPTASATGEPDPAPSATVTTIPPTSSVPTTASLLAFPYTIAGVAWPVESTVASADLPVFRASGSTTTILSSDNIDVAGGATENAASTVAGQKALVADDDLTKLVRAAASAPSQLSWKSDVAQLSAELATLTLEQPSDVRTLFTTLGRGWATSDDRLAETLASIERLDWTATTTLARTMSATPTDATLDSKKAAPARISVLTPLVDADAALGRFATALKSPTVVTAPERLRMLALSSVSWSRNVAGLTTEIAQLEATTARTTDLVKVVDGSSVNVLGDRSSLPVLVQNDTSSVAVVSLRVVPSNYFLNVEKNDIAITLQPNSQQRVFVPVQSVANGKVTLTLSLSSATGESLSNPTQATVNVRAGWETAITLIFGIAVLVLFGGGIYRSVRRRQRSKAAKAAQ